VAAVQHLDRLSASTSRSGLLPALPRPLWRDRALDGVARAVGAACSGGSHVPGRVRGETAAALLRLHAARPGAFDAADAAQLLGCLDALNRSLLGAEEWPEAGLPPCQRAYLEGLPALAADASFPPFTVSAPVRRTRVSPSMHNTATSMSSVHRVK